MLKCCPRPVVRTLGTRAVFAQRKMATIRSSVPHEDRTAAEPREGQLEAVVLANIKEVNDNVRLLRLFPVINRTIKFLPGQWLDTFIPGIPRAGGFTLTSTPDQARASVSTPPYLELAIQKSRNPPAQWLWKPSEEIIGTQLVVRVGGSFTWPPPHLDVAKVDRLVLVAGGVGIKILFLPRLMDLVAAAADSNVTLRLFLTGTGDQGYIEHGKLPNSTFGGRIQEIDLLKAIDGYKKNVFGPEHDRKGTVALVCGPPKMTDEMVAYLQKQPGMSLDRVLCEKWW
ncbi:uncharacterized protein MYCGRDRAFT_98569 [Zymoseptoria tritici IPO323]|uniref:FAD-binding FR-type domain-containing protein n=1 Tax=Zymoseptoria tritici (strain CBS 115943 / IPO323) TaxID=336722 RepID=F9WY29_ZYMTI|nr:uncharacterized protein MYCGRDRAFT_98569 [Zymoseptoria tritici IPO323]EGP92264.1 hypothetical protein MYCGRDRAFT_98569 [Zymoseptoria tritici IPO323]